MAPRASRGAAVKPRRAPVAMVRRASRREWRSDRVGHRRKWRSGRGGEWAWRSIRVGQRWAMVAEASEVEADRGRAVAACAGSKGGGGAGAGGAAATGGTAGTGGAGHAGGASGAGGAVTASGVRSDVHARHLGARLRVPRRGQHSVRPVHHAAARRHLPQRRRAQGNDDASGRHHVSRRRLDRQQAGGAQGEHVELLQPVPQTRLSRLQRRVPVGRRHRGRRHRPRRRPGRAPRREVVLGSHGLLSRRQDPLRHHGRVGGRAAGADGRDGDARGPARTHQPHRLHHRRDRQRLRSGGRDRSAREERLLRRAVAPRQHAEPGRRSPNRSAPSPTFARTSRRSSRFRATWTPRSPGARARSSTIS